jgi:hypothetical protein
MTRPDASLFAHLFQWITYAGLCLAAGYGDQHALALLCAEGRR